jgi:hypothetical protein
MLEPVTATVAALVAERVYDRSSRARQRRRLLKLAMGALPPGTEIGEHYGPHAGWYVKLADDLTPDKGSG